MDTTIILSFDKGDPSVGIFGYGFAARVANETTMCEISDYNEDFSKCEFMWTNDDTDEEIPRPVFGGDMVEHTLHGFAVGVYASEERAYEGMAQEGDEVNLAEHVSDNRPVAQEK